MKMIEWLRCFRQQQPATAVEIRRNLARIKYQYDHATAERDALALDAVNSDAAAEHYRQLDDTAAEFLERMELLAAALPIAEEREAEAARVKEAAALAKRIEEFDTATSETRRFLEPILARLVTAEELTRARDLRDQLRRDAAFLSNRSSEVRLRRPVDPLHEIYVALAHRVERIERARWIGSSPITFKEKSA